MAGAVASTTVQTVLGEGARWDARRAELLGVDILAGHVYRERIDDQGDLIRIRSYSIPGTVGAIAPIEGDEGWAPISTVCGEPARSARKRWIICPFRPTGFTRLIDPAMSSVRLAGLSL